MKNRKVIAPKAGIRAHVCETVTVFHYKTGHMPLGQGASQRVRIMFYRTETVKQGGKVKLRRVRRADAEKAV